MKSFKDKVSSGFVLLSESAQSLTSTDWWKAINEGGRGLKESLADKVSAAMDSGFSIGQIDPETGLKMSPWNHRILDEGHGISQSLDKALEAAQAEGASKLEGFQAWARSYVTDLSSNAGMPIPGADKAYEFLREHLGVADKTAVDIVTVNGQEALEALIGSTIIVVALLFAWKKKDAETFSKCIGSMGIVALFTANPLSALAAVVFLAKAYNEKLVDREKVKKGAIVTGAGLGVAALIPGPILFGLVPAIAVSLYLEKNYDSSKSIIENCDNLRDITEKKIQVIVSKSTWFAQRAS